MNNRRKEEFDILRTLIIISAIILHYSNRFDLGILDFPFRFVQKQIFNVGSFFFFTAGYMAHQIYLVRFQNDAVKTIISVFENIASQQQGGLFAARAREPDICVDRAHPKTHPRLLYSIHGHPSADYYHVARAHTAK